MSMKVGGHRFPSWWHAVHAGSLAAARAALVILLAGVLFIGPAGLMGAAAWALAEWAGWSAAGRWLAATAAWAACATLMSWAVRRYERGSGRPRPAFSDGSATPPDTVLERVGMTARMSKTANLGKPS